VEGGNIYRFMGAANHLNRSADRRLGTDTNTGEPAGCIQCSRHTGWRRDFLDGLPERYLRTPAKPLRGMEMVGKSGPGILCRSGPNAATARTWSSSPRPAGAVATISGVLAGWG
jgi:hypothetical protein